MSLSELIAKLESAEAGSRELSNEIAEACGWERNDARSFVWKSPEGLAHHVSPDFSRSLDAALTLVPERYSWKVYVHPSLEEADGPRTYVEVYKLGKIIRDEILIKGRAILTGPHEASAPSPALALCIAALIARSAQ